MEAIRKKVALVTGANTGVGFQVARALADNGYTVYVGARDLQKGEAAASEIGTNAKAIHLDITDTASINEAVAKISKDFG
ncbi:MAG: dehydrogenase, partial [Flavobacterium psychrophilum]